jgi:CheY-like chemotaxis protein
MSSRGAAPLIWTIEDYADNRELLADVLASAGFRVRTFCNGQAPLDALARGQDGADGRIEAPAVVLLDMLMPQLDGVGFMAARGAHPLLAGVRIVLMSGSDVAVARAAGAATQPSLGEAAYLRKPFELEELLHVVRRLVGAAPTDAHVASI